mgnify:CR=1 FL=1
MSLPAWGEWIEMSAAGEYAAERPVSLPAWGEWIEIIIILQDHIKGNGLSPHGESGLKLSFKIVSKN